MTWLELALNVAAPRKSPSRRLTVGFALVSVYLIWGSTYLAIRLATTDFPPFMMLGIRYGIAGGILYTALRIRGAPNPSLREWGAAALVGTLLLGIGNGGLAYAEQWIHTGLAALLLATTALWSALFAGLWGQWPSRREWLGMGIGLAGVGLLNLEGNLQANPGAAALLIGLAMTWAFGSVWSRHLPLPRGLMSSAAQMVTGSLSLFGLGGLQGEHFTTVPTGVPLGALIYLIAFGSLIGFTSFSYLMQNVRLSLATSYTFVNPVVALLLGVGFANEQITGLGYTAMGVILIGVILVVIKDKPTVKA